MHYWAELQSFVTFLYSIEYSMCTILSGRYKNSTTAGMKSNSCLPAHSNVAQQFAIIKEEDSLQQTLQGEFKARVSN